jgi:hypothetical protein
LAKAARAKPGQPVGPKKMHLPAGILPKIGEATTVDRNDVKAR